MGTDSKLWHKKSNQSIDCDRKYNLINDYTIAKGLQTYLLTHGLPKFMLIDLCGELDRLKNTTRNVGDGKSIYEQIVDELKAFEDNDIFVLIDDSHENYYKI